VLASGNDFDRRPRGHKGVVDVDECVKFAAEFYCHVTALHWQESASNKAFYTGDPG
jgi:hypothetical protein